jgi:aromatic ring-opening dioxygenase LigB subunit
MWKFLKELPNGKYRSAMGYEAPYCSINIKTLAELAACIFRLAQENLKSKYIFFNYLDGGGSKLPRNLGTYIGLPVCIFMVPTTLLLSTTSEDRNFADFQAFGCKLAKENKTLWMKNDV